MHRLRAKDTMNVVLRAALVPFEADSSMYTETVELLDEHAEIYPTGAEVWVSMIRLNSRGFRLIKLPFRYILRSPGSQILG